jgi:hypothetical protein
MKFYDNCFKLTADFNVESIAMPSSRCQTNNDVDCTSKLCDTGVRLSGLYRKGCRERMMANGAWTAAHTKRQSELSSRIIENARAYRDSLSAEVKEARRARRRVHNASNREARNAAQRQRYANMKLDPMKYEARRQKDNEQRRKRCVELSERKLTRARADDDVDDEEAAEVQGAILCDNVIVISDDEGEIAVAVADDSSGSDVEGIEFVSSDDEQCLLTGR